VNKDISQRKTKKRQKPEAVIILLILLLALNISIRFSIDASSPPLKIEPQTDEVRRLHAVLIRGSEIIYNGFKIKLAGHEKQDENLIRIANGEIRKGVKETFKWRQGITALYKKYNVAQKER
jgi:hypothetical protein